MIDNKMDNPLEQAASIIVKAAKMQKLKKAVLSKPLYKQAETIRATLTPMLQKGKLYLQKEEFFTDGKARHQNWEAGDSSVGLIRDLMGDYGETNILLIGGNCECRVSKSGNSVFLRQNEAEAILQNEDVVETQNGNDHQKQYILKGHEPFLKALGVSDAMGRVHDKKQAKYRQINRFLELIRDVESALPSEGPLHICDLCCGKSYLSFAVYHYFAVIKGREVHMQGVDLKQDVITYCNEVAQKVGFTGLSFYAGDVSRFEVEKPVHMVLSLHACDTATDMVLERAMHWGADLILSTPCCHHELNHTLNCKTLSFIAEHSMLRQKFCDAATDALRLKLLEANGYRVEAVELIDPEETPKNIMLRAQKSKKYDPMGVKAKTAMAEYKSAKAFLLGEDV